MTYCFQVVDSRVKPTYSLSKHCLPGKKTLQQQAVLAAAAAAQSGAVETLGETHHCHVASVKGLHTGLQAFDLLRCRDHS